MSRYYQVVLTSGEVINVPRDRARTRYEEIGLYGMCAVLERVRRARAYKAAVRRFDATVRAIIMPDGTEIKEF